MKQFYLIVLLCITCIWCISAVVNRNRAQCFHFKWLGPTYSNDSKIVNCTNQLVTPCTGYLIRSSTPPDTVKLWNDGTPEAAFTELTPGNVCLKYTFFYNNELVNTTSFRGKVIEDKTSAVTSGCYEHFVDGYKIELCVCKSIAGQLPCNVSSKQSYSVIMIISVSIVLSISIFY